MFLWFQQNESNFIGNFHMMSEPCHVRQKIIGIWVRRQQDKADVS